MWYHSVDRRRALPDRRHLVADGDGRHHDHAAARRDADQARLGARGRFPASCPRSSTRDGKPVRARTQGGYLVITQPWPSCCAHLRRPRALRASSTGARSRASTSPATARAATRTATSGSWAASTTCSTSPATGWARWRSRARSSRIPRWPRPRSSAGRTSSRARRIAAFVTLEAGTRPTTRCKKELKEHVGKEIGALARPDDIRFTDALPKTRSGKIMRRLLRDIAAGKETLGDTTTLEDYSVLAKLREDEE